MNQELDYAEMLEIPVSTVNVVKKKSLFNFRNKPVAPKEQPASPQDDLKDLVVDSVNERVGAFVYSEDLSDPPKPEKKRKFFGGDKGSKIILTELIAVCLLAAAIFLTNFFMPQSAINTFIGTLTGKSSDTQTEPTYNEIKLSSVVSELSDATVTVTDGGVLTFTAQSSVYPVCAGTVASVKEEEGVYTVQIAHTSTFSSVVTGLTDVYAVEGTKVKANIPFAYSDGKKEVRVSMYDGDTLLNCYSLSGEVPVWNS